MIEAANRYFSSREDALCDGMPSRLLKSDGKIGTEAESNLTESQQFSPRATAPP